MFDDREAVVAVPVREARVVRVGTTAAGVPRDLLWDGVRYHVTDRPTRWRGRPDEWDFGPGGGDDGARDARNDGLPGLWRFQATPLDADAPSVVVDVIGTGGGWVLLGVVR
ncbi:hypothetical protein DEI92_13765 [Curtobacterium sp. MCBD17_034]|uniref:hypothetical protein n=1 Tax=unclassified Curtobacterium TaxID=257496 RepID=UPI000DA7367C|nr:MULTISPECIES: hypothetical protein [unclassified Curtobacterium]PZF56849.1 hypothetical protein DEI92_13765 [Curtobacterium sp. MCBD17_034]PZM33805.1 hypothetical protein DEI90_11150 [Curtobacterium sp. MCBD17_031]